jgi:hypothetical protein
VLPFGGERDVVGADDGEARAVTCVEAGRADDGVDGAGGAVGAVDGVRADTGDVRKVYVYVWFLDGARRVKGGVGG